MPPEGSGDIYFDIETLRLSDEVEGGWNSIHKFGLAVAVTWDEQGKFREWYEDDAQALVSEMNGFGRIISYNGDRFDFEVLSAYASVNSINGLRAKSLDLLSDLRSKLGFRVALDKLAAATLGSKKSGSGLKAVEWWRAGQRAKVVEYCRQDVQLLIDLVTFAREKGKVVVDGRDVAVDWS